MTRLRTIMWVAVATINVLTFIAIIVILTFNVWHDGDYGDDTAAGHFEYAITTTWFVAFIAALVLSMGATVADGWLSKRIDAEKAEADERAVTLDPENYDALLEARAWGKRHGTDLTVEAHANIAVAAYVDGINPRGDSA